LPNVKSAEKRMRTSRVRAERNKQNRSRLRTALKKVRQAETPEAANEALRAATALIDRAAARRLIHPNRAARTKSRLAAMIQRMEQPAS
jgi:small subunit ribosomal protein S20